MPVRYDYDGNGMPFHYVDNPVHTIFFLKGDNESVKRSINLVINTSLHRYPDSKPLYDNISIRHRNGYVIIDIVTNNFIPQLFEEIRLCTGIGNVMYAVYAQDFGRLITNDRDKDIVDSRGLFALPVDYEVEIDDDDNMFPEEYELSISDPDEQ